jgi:uncharacterized protein (TIGR00369 family)
MILEMWERLHRLPAGKTLFSHFLGRMVPYTGTLGAKVLALEPGYARVELTDRRKVRNHLNSIHAVALMNLGEVASGLAFMTGLPKGMRAILTGFEVEFLKKARGTLECECRSPRVLSSESQDYIVEASITDSSKTVVCRVRAKWRASTKK